ncbi:MAG: HAD family phosphatase [Deltaproteobacteria bacterium]|nr:MAG: HAD family phosphatase [Deltaproteobacteria bacterium]
MRPVAELDRARCEGLVGVFCDIDDTLSWEGRLVPAAFAALASLQKARLRVIPITGRPGGWVDHIARMWPVDGVVGENGGLWFYMDEHGLVRRFLQSAEERAENRARLDALASRILREVPGTALASDQTYRDLDLAIDFCEDVEPLSDAEIDRIVACFDEAGCTSKVSSIHVNGWYGDFDKLTGCTRLVQDLYGEALDPAKWAYFGDSANDEPMFAFFEASIGVANVRDFLPRMKAHPAFVTEGSGGHGFAEAIAHILAMRG